MSSSRHLHPVAWMPGGDGVWIERAWEDYRVGLGGGMVGRGSLFSIPLKHTNSAAMSGGWTASFAAPAASAPSPRCPVVTGCSLGVVGRCADGDTAMVGLFDRSIEFSHSRALVAATSQDRTGLRQSHSSSAQVLVRSVHCFNGFV